MSGMSKAAQEREVGEAKERLLELLGEEKRVFTILRHVSSSGMLRVIDVLVIKAREGEIEVYHVGYNVAKLLGLKYDSDKEGVRVSGVGMDMGFWLAYEMSETLYGDGYALKQRWI